MIDNERLASAKIKPNHSDCYGTAFYLAEISDQDNVLSAKSIQNYLKQCVEITSPIPGCFVHIWNGFVSHIAVVEKVNPIRVIYRNGIDGEVKTDTSLIEMLFDYGGVDIGMSYLVRKK